MVKHILAFELNSTSNSTKKIKKKQILFQRKSKSLTFDESDKSCISSFD